MKFDRSVFPVFGIFGGFGSLVRGGFVVRFWADRSGFGRVRSSIFPDLGLDSAYFWLNRFEIRAFKIGKFNRFKGAPLKGLL